MTQWHMDSKRKSTGGISYTHRRRDKRLHEKGGEFSKTQVAEEKEARKKVRLLGGKTKTIARKIKFATITDPKTKKTLKAEILDVVENLANRQFARQDIITKNAVIEVKIAEKTVKARVTSRPGQSGVIQGILLE